MNYYIKKLDMINSSPAVMEHVIAKSGFTLT